MSAYRKSPNNIFNIDRLEFKIKNKILRLLTKTINKVNIKAIKQKDQRQAKPIKDIDRIAISRL